MIDRRRPLVVPLLLLACLASPAGAAITYVGPDEGPDGPGGLTGWTGSDVWYANVTEANNQDDAPLFGAPASIVGNAIDFNPTGFNAQANASAAPFASEVTDSQLSFEVWALPGRFIENLQLTESGDATIAALASSLETVASVTTTVFIEVTAIDGELVTPINLGAKSLEFTPSGGNFNNAEDGEQPYDLSPGASTVFSTDWFGELFVDFEAELNALSVPFDFGATRVNVTLNNTLTATAVNGESAFIAKKDADGVTVTANIPEPATLALLALAGLAAPRRR